MSKAFDNVSHDQLLRKLRYYGFGGMLLAWLESYLCNHSQRVTTLGAASGTLPVTSGLPQGSILGPMLLLLYVNSLPEAVQSRQVAMLTDDTKVLKRSSHQVTRKIFNNTYQSCKSVRSRQTSI